MVKNHNVKGYFGKETRSCNISLFENQNFFLTWDQQIIERTIVICK